MTVRVPWMLTLSKSSRSSLAGAGEAQWKTRDTSFRDCSRAWGIVCQTTIEWMNEYHWIVFEKSTAFLFCDTVLGSVLSDHIPKVRVIVPPACRRGLPGGRRHRAARSSDGCRTQKPSIPDPPASPPGVCPGNRTPRWLHTVCCSVRQTGETALFTNWVVSETQPHHKRLKQNSQPLKVFQLTGRTRVAIMNEKNNRWVKYSGTRRALVSEDEKNVACSFKVCPCELFVHELAYFTIYLQQARAS